jgi:hypothetical protein
VIVSEAMWDDDVVRPRASSTADLGAMARRPSMGSAGPLPDKTPITIDDEPLPMGAQRAGSDDFDDVDSTEAAGPTPAPEGGDAMMGDPAAGRAGLWSQGAPPAYNAPLDLPPAYSERDPHPERVPWWKKARRSIGRGARKLAGWLGLGSLLGRGR